MINNDEQKLPIILIGNTFKYEIEATVKLFIPAERFNFTDDIAYKLQDEYILVELEELEDKLILSSEVNYQKQIESFKVDMSLEIAEQKSAKELELCRLVYKCLQKITGKTPAWGLMTGIRPVKMVMDLMKKGNSNDEIVDILQSKYQISDSKLDLAFSVAENQLPILEKINKRAVSLYISIPFCPTRCSYCSFVSHSMASAIKLIPDYVEYLTREIKIIGDLVKEYGVDVDTIYFGGGTPTSISAEDIKTIMKSVEENFDISKIREYNYEAGRADTITEEKLRVIKEYGATRISVNPQTLNDDVLKVIGRNHTGADTIKCYEMAKKIGFNNINMDLIAGLPTESVESFKNSLDKIISLDPESITVHTLTLKRSASLYEDGKTHLKNHIEEMVDYSIEQLMKNEYNPYYLYRQKNTLDNLENVGYSKKGFESYYNIFIMDETQTILGAGCAASTKLVYPDGKISRIHNYKFPYEYINRFDLLMDKKTEVSECLKKIRNLQEL